MTQHQPITKGERRKTNAFPQSSKNRPLERALTQNNSSICSLSITSPVATENTRSSNSFLTPPFRILGTEERRKEVPDVIRDDAMDELGPSVNLATTAHSLLPSILDDRIPELANTGASSNLSALTFLGAPFYQRRRIRSMQWWRHRSKLCQSILLGALLGGSLVACFLSLLNERNPQALPYLSARVETAFFWKDSSCASCQNDRIRRGYDHQQSAGVFSYWNLYENKRIKLASVQSEKRALASSPSSSIGSSNSFFAGDNDDYKDTQLVIAGKMAVDDAPCNIAQYNLKKNKWSLTERIQLSLYNSYSGGEVYSLLANHTSTRHIEETSKDEESETKR
jgi:hypothetical protein